MPLGRDDTPGIFFVSRWKVVMAASNFLKGDQNRWRAEKLADFFARSAVTLRERVVKAAKDSGIP